MWTGCMKDILRVTFTRTGGSLGTWILHPNAAVESSSSGKDSKITPRLEQKGLSSRPRLPPSLASVIKGGVFTRRTY